VADFYRLSPPEHKDSLQNLKKQVERAGKKLMGRASIAVGGSIFLLCLHKDKD
jgi:hypothetical protein